MSNFLTKKERFDALMKLSEFWMIKFNSRRGYEWKVTAGLWALMAAVAVYVKHRPPEGVLILALTFIVLGYTFLWVRLMHARNHHNEKMAEYYMAHAETILVPAEQPEKPEYTGRWLHFLKDGVAVFQIAATIFLAAGIYWFMEAPARTTTNLTPPATQISN